MPPVPQDLVARLIWTTIEARGSLTRAQLEALTGLPKSTVTEHVRVMLRQRILEEITPTATGSRGRPARVLTLGDPGSFTGVVVLSHSADLAQGTVRVAFGSYRGFIRWMRTAEASGDPLAAAVELVEQGLADLPGMNLSDVLLVLPLPVIRRQEHGDGIPQLRVIEPLAYVLGAAPQDGLSRRLGVPVAIANDADMGALGEATFGVGNGVPDLVYIKTIHGLGMGIVFNGELVEPTSVPVGELAHLRQPGGDARCLCGSVGCWFGQVSEGLGLVSMVRALGVDVLSWVDLESRCAADDQHVHAALREVGAHVGAAFAQFAMLSGRFTVILENGVESVFEPLAEGVTAAVSGTAPDWTADQTLIRRGLLGEEAEVLGGFEYVRTRRQLSPVVGGRAHPQV